MRDPLNAFLDTPDIPVPHALDGPLAGLSLAVKDIFDVVGYVTGCGNPVKAAEGRPARATAPSVQKLLDAGVRFAGKTQTEELAFSMIGQNVHFPHPVNPAAPDRVTGGSSSGSVAAVAGGLADIGTGSDTGGSIRAPASFCGLVGLRTTHGDISLAGTMPLAPSFDTFGWFAEDIATYRKVARVFLADKAGAEPARSAAAAPRLLSIASLDTLLSDNAAAIEYQRMSNVIQDRLGSIHLAPAPEHDIDDLYWAMRRLQAKEAWTAHGTWISSGDRKLGKSVAERFAFGATVSLAEAREEAARRTAFTSWLADLLGQDGVIVMPTVPGAAPHAADPDAFGPFREQAIRLFCWSGLSGFPQITVPLGQIGGAPFGISLLGPSGSDLWLIDLAERLINRS